MKDVIEFFGSKTSMAWRMGVDKAAVSHWLRYGLPPGRAIQIERLSGGRFKAIEIEGKTMDDGDRYGE